MADATVPKAPSARRRRLRLVTLGGCNVLNIGVVLSGIWDHRHVWNVTWPSLGSRPFPLTRRPDGPEFDELQDFLVREADKTVIPALLEAPPDVVVLAVAQNVLNDFVVLGDRVMPDFTTPLYLSPHRLNGRPRPSLSDFVPPGYRIIGCDSKDFPALMKRGFRQAYSQLLSPLIARGTRVFIHGHVLATKALTGEGVVDDVANVSERQLVLAKKLIRVAEGYSGIETLQQIAGLNFTSDDAPNGRWAFHPIKEQYALLAHRLALKVEPDRAEEVLIRFLFESRLEQIRAREQADAERKEQAEPARREAIDAESSVENAETDADAEERTSLTWRMAAPLRAVGRQFAGRGRGR